MRRLILGIIAVICLDIAFIVYPGANRERVARPAVINSDVYQLYPGPDRLNDRIETARSTGIDPKNSDVDSTAVPITDDRKPNKLTGTGNTDRREENGETRRRFENKDRRAVAATRGLSDRDANFKPIIIRVKSRNDGPQSLDRNGVAAYRVKNNSSRPDERSFIGSVIPIVKKPYEWIKFIGSKLR